MPAIAVGVFESNGLEFIFSGIFSHSELPRLSPEEVRMKEELYAWFQMLEYEETFGHDKVFYF